MRPPRLGLLAASLALVVYLAEAAPERAAGREDGIGQELESPVVDSIVVVERFELAPNRVGRFPHDWQGRTGWWQRRTRRVIDLYYTVRKEGEDVFLRAETVGRATNAGCAVDVDLRVHRILRWRWRVHRLPEGGNEEKRSRNDSGAAVRLVFCGDWPIPKTLKYVWSSSLPVGRETQSPLSWKTKVVVVESGEGKLGEWVWEEVNAYEDYVRAFGEEPNLVKAFAILTDGDNTKSAVMADYDDFAFLLAPTDSTEAGITALGDGKAREAGPRF